MTTYELHETIELDAPAAVAWDVVSDYGRDPAWRAGVTTMGAGRAEPGTVTAEVLRMGGRTYRNGGEVVLVEPGRRFTWRTTSGADADGARTVEPLGDERCRVHLELRVRARGIQRLAVPILRRTLAGDARRLRALVSALAEVRLG